MFKKLGLQLYTVRDYLCDASLADYTFARLAEMGYTEGQTAGSTFDNKLFGELAAKHGIKIVGTHYSYTKILEQPEETMELHRMWGTTNVGIGGMPREARTGGIDGLKKFVLDYNRAAELYAKHGFKLTYHNHNYEFTRVDGKKTMMDVLAEGFDPATISFVLDTCWVAAGGGDVVSWMEKLEGRIDILHLKDMTLKQKNGVYQPEMCEIGYGNLSWDPIMKTAEKIGVKHYVVEQDAYFTGSPFNSLKMSAEFLKKYMI